MIVSPATTFIRAYAYRLRGPLGRGVATLVMTIVIGTIVDRTTGQPLTAVDVRAVGPAKATARTNDSGSFTLRALTPGRYTLTLSSDDVPPQTFALTVGGAKQQHVSLTACSTTLDYSCAP